MKALLLAALALMTCAYGPRSAQAAADDIPLKIDWDFYKKVWLPDLPAARPTEPKLPAYDEAKAAQFLDHYGSEWAQQNHCGTCHTNLVALVARPSVKSVPQGAAIKTIRSELLRWADESRAKPEDFTVSILVPTAAALAINDIKSNRPVDPRVSELWDYLWSHQSDDGSWKYTVIPELLPFLERDRYYIAMLGALAAGYMRDIRSAAHPVNEPHVAKLKAYLAANPPTSLHHQVVLLWVSAHLDGVLTDEQKSVIERALLAKQNADGGWTLAAMGEWPRHDGPANDPHGPSDGYATALASLTLCEARHAAGTPAIDRSLAWLKSNQRASGRWYTRSLYTSGFRNYISNLGTGYAVMALDSCGAVAPVRSAAAMAATPPTRP